MVRPSGPKNEIVSKLVYPIWSKTVLVEPEMVISAAHREQVASFCHDQGTSAIGIIWERFSETIVLDIHGPSGLVSSTTIIAGEPQEDSKSPNSELLASPSVHTLVGVIRGMGVSVQAALRLDHGYQVRS